MTLPTTPAQGSTLKIQVSATSGGVKTDVNGMSRWSRRASRAVTTTQVFHRTAPYRNIAPRDAGITLSGILITGDPGQTLLRDAELAGTSVFVTILPDGTNGFMQECMVASLSGDASPEGFQENGFELTAVAAPTIVALGPIM
jgi:hypothetical protein